MGRGRQYKSAGRDHIGSVVVGVVTEQAEVVVVVNFGMAGVYE